MCKQVFYMRISTKERKEDDKKKDQEQTFERQKGILERAGYVLTDENTFADRISGRTKAEERENYYKMLDILEEGDWCIFTESSRFSRSYLAGMEMLDTLIFDKKVNVRFVSNGIELMANSKFNPYTWYTISQMLLADELQRRVISYNTANGLKAKRELLGDSFKIGREKTEIEPDKIEQIRQLYGTCSVAEIQRRVGLGRRVVDRVIREECRDEI